MTDPTAAPAFPTGTVLGYPRIGRRRELKKAVEAFWAGSITGEELETRAAELRAATRVRLASLGLVARIPRSQRASATTTTSWMPRSTFPK